MLTGDVAMGQPGAVSFNPLNELCETRSARSRRGDRSQGGEHAPAREARKGERGNPVRWDWRTPLRSVRWPMQTAIESGAAAAALHSRATTRGCCGGRPFRPPSARASAACTDPIPYSSARAGELGARDGEGRESTPRSSRDDRRSLRA